MVVVHKDMQRTSCPSQLLWAWRSLAPVHAVHPSTLRTHSIGLLGVQVGPFVGPIFNLFAGGMLALASAEAAACLAHSGCAASQFKFCMGLVPPHTSPVALHGQCYIRFSPMPAEFWLHMLQVHFCCMLACSSLIVRVCQLALLQAI